MRLILTDVSEDSTNKREGERRLRFTTSSGIPVQRVYAPKDREGADEGRDLGLPGAYPFTRGVQPTMYRSRLWTMRQYSGFGTARETNQRFRYLLEQGQSGLSVAFDLPTQMGYDSDHPMAMGEVGAEARALGEGAEVEVARPDLGPGVSDTDERLPEILVGKTDGFHHRGAFGASSPRE